MGLNYKKDKMYKFYHTFFYIMMISGLMFLSGLYFNINITRTESILYGLIAVSFMFHARSQLDYIKLKSKIKNG